MKRIFAIIALVITGLLLVSCEEVPQDPDAAIDLTHQGSLIQNYDDISTLEDVTFTLKTSWFEENNITNFEINWYVNNKLMVEAKDKFTYTQVVERHGTINVKVVVTHDKGELSLTETITVQRIPVIIVLSAGGDSHIPLVMDDESLEVDFEATIKGIFLEKDRDFNWVVKKLVDGEPQPVDTIAVDEYVLVEGSRDLTVSTTIDFRDYGAGSFNVTLEKAKESELQGATTHISNTIFVNLTYGDFKVELRDGNKAETTEIGNEFVSLGTRKLEINGVNEEGTYQWLLNGEELVGETGLEYTHTDLGLGGYLYRARFTSTDGKLVLYSEPLLLINGVLVKDALELKNAVEGGVKGIVLANDIYYNPGALDLGEDGEPLGYDATTLIIDYSATIYGDGYHLEAPGIQEFVKVVGTQDVNFSNLKLSKSHKYGIKIERSHNIYLEDLKFERFGSVDITSLKSGDFNAGVYIDRSKAIVNNIEFLSAGLVGIRIDQHLNTEGVSELEFLGTLVYNEEDPVLLPIGSGKSDLDGIIVDAPGFDYFALPAGDITIRRWDNQGDALGWQIYDQTKTEYQIGEVLDLHLIGINIDISFLGNFEIAAEDGLAFVEMFIDIFKQYGIVEIVDADDVVLSTYYVVGFNKNIETRGDKIIYSEDKVIPPTNQWDSTFGIEPELPDVPGQYKMKIYIGEEFYLGSVLITVVEE